MNTRWLSIPIDPFRNLYEVSDKGTVRRVPGLSSNGRMLAGGPLVPVMQKNYYVVNLRFGKHSKTMKVHHLVAFAFIGFPPGPIGLKGYTINHKNFDKLDNRADNLEWLTASDNRKHAQDAGRFARGEHHGISKVDESTVLYIRQQRAEGRTFASIAASVGVITKATVRAIATRRTWQHVQ